MTRLVLATIFFHLLALIHIYLIPGSLNPIQLFTFMYFITIFLYALNAMASRAKAEDVVKRGIFSYKPILLLLPFHFMIFISEQIFVMSLRNRMALGGIAFNVICISLVVESSLRMCRIIDLLLRDVLSGTVIKR
jgi:hypothetical protein